MNTTISSSGHHQPVSFLLLAAILVMALALCSCTTPGGSGKSGSGGLKLRGIDASGLDLSSKPAVDPRLVRGVLANGLAWYIFPTTDGGPIQMHLVVDAGSMKEDPDQAGAAHFVEHMAFNGTTHFAPGDLLKFGFSEERNAYTSQEQTVFIQSIPDNNAKTLAETFLMFQDCGMGIGFDPAEVEKERGVILEELRRQKGSMVDTQNFLAFLEPRQLLVRQLPIGTEESLKTMSRDKIKQFWDTWYQPGNMAVIITGPVDSGQIEGLVREYLGPLASHGPEAASTPANTGPEQDTEVETNRFFVPAWEDPTNSYMIIYRSLKPAGSGTLGLIKEDLADRIMCLAWYNRISFLIDKGTLSMLSASSEVLKPWKNKRYISYGVNAGPGSIFDNYRLLIQEARRIQLHGFSQDEIDRARDQVRKEVDDQFGKRSNPDAGKLARDIAAFHLGNGLFMSPEDEHSASLAILDSLDKPTLDMAGREWFKLEGAMVKISPTAKDHSIPPGLFGRETRDTAQKDIPDLPPGSLPGILANEEHTALTPGSIVKTEILEDIDSEVWTLSNGGRVIWRKMDGSPRIVLRAIRQGGFSSLPGNDVLSARLMLQLFYNSGLGGMEATELKDWMNKEGLSLQFWMDDYFQGYMGSGPSDQGRLENLFRNLRSQCTRPGFTAAAFDRTFQDFYNYLRVLPGSWPLLQNQSVMNLRAQDNMRLAALDDINLQTFEGETANRIWSDFYGNGKDYTWVICGNADTRELRSLVATYLASMPVRDITAIPGNQAWSIPPGGLSESRYLNGLDASRVHLETTGSDLAWPGQNDFILDTVVALLQNRLFNKLREEMSATYDPSVQAWHFGPNPGKWMLALDFACAPGREDALIEAAKKEIATIAKDPLDAPTLDKLREVMAQKLNPLTFGYDGWAQKIEYFSARGIDPAIINDVPSKVDDLEIAQIKDWMQANLVNGNWLRMDVLGN